MTTFSQDNNKDINETIINFLGNRPNVIAAYGYGSGVIKQNGYTNNDKPQLNLILVVDDLKEWHLSNIEKNPNDYSKIGKFTFKNNNIKNLKGNTGITYLSNIEENNNLFKYGTIERYDLQNHLYYWDSFYMPGRFQKVVSVIKSTDGLNEAIKTNRDNALMIAAYLLNKKIVNKKELLTKLCSLSYLGDTRMRFAENPEKISNIVNGSYKELLSIYDFNKPYFKELNDEYLYVDLNIIKYSFMQYPMALRNHLTNDVFQDDIVDYLTELNRYESIDQTLKGIKTNGIVKSVNYASKKLAKRFKH